MATDEAKQNELRSELLVLLDRVYEQKFYEPVAADKLCEQLSLSRQELEILITPFLVQGLVEKDAETLGGHFYLRLSAYGKEKYDEATGNDTNQSIRQSLLKTLAEEYEKNVHVIVSAEKMAAQLGVDRNRVCFNLLIMERHGMVSISGRVGAGHVPHHVSLTPEGKFAYDNPEPKVIFLSHAAVDEEIAKYLKQVIEGSFPETHVFVSTDPEDLPPGDLWFETILSELSSAHVLMVLATERGISRRWVWFETGAGWARGVKIIPCCAGKVRKGQLPPSFSKWQALNIDEEVDFRILLDILAKEYGSPSQPPDSSAVISNLTRLDVRAEERARVPAKAPYTDEMRAQVEKGLRKLTEGEKEAVRLLFIEGQLTDRRAIDIVREKGLLKDNPTYIFIRICAETGFVQRVWSRNESEDRVGYQGPWILNEHLKPLLEQFLFPRE